MKSHMGTINPIADILEMELSTTDYIRSKIIILLASETQTLLVAN